MKKRVTTYKMRGIAPEIQETKYEAEAVISRKERVLKGSRTFCKAKMKSVRVQVEPKRKEAEGGEKAIRSENVDMSNEKDGKEESIRPKTQRFREEEKIESGKRGFGKKEERKLRSRTKQTVPNGKLKGVARWVEKEKKAKITVPRRSVDGT